MLIVSLHVISISNVYIKHCSKLLIPYDLCTLKALFQHISDQCMHHCSNILMPIVHIEHYFIALYYFIYYLLKQIYIAQFSTAVMTR